jgi:hypothetical protein
MQAVNVPLLLISALFLLCVLGVSTNRTIDDQYGDNVTGLLPLYTPASAVGRSVAQCSECVDPSEAFGQTWTSLTYNPGLPGGVHVELQFYGEYFILGTVLTVYSTFDEGTAIYIYFITTTNTTENGIASLTQSNFTLDGQFDDSYHQTADNSTSVQYKVLAYSKDSLNNANHTLSFGTTDVDHDVLTIFDYAIYTSVLHLTIVLSP